MLHHSPAKGAAAAPRELSASWEVIPSDDPSNLAPSPSTSSSSNWQPDSPVSQPAIMPPSWRDEYLTSLREAEKNHPVNKDLVVACSQLNDRIAALEAEKAAWQSSSPRTSTPAPKDTSKAAAGDVSSADPGGVRLRLDLAEALRAKGQLEARLRKSEEERDQLRSAKTSDNRSIRETTAERNNLRMKLRDKEEELRGKTKMLEDLQDEVLALNLQLNVAEQQKAKVQSENKQLVDRWMKRVGQEAEAMNLANEPIFAKRR